MARLQAFPVKDMTKAQRALYEIIPRSASRTEVHGPILAMMLEPELGAITERVSLFFKDSKRFERRLREVAILVTARSWTCHYEWHAHAEAAIEHGVPADVVEAIRTDATPRFQRDDEAVVYAVAKALSDERRLPDAIYQRATDAFGEAGVSELISIIGYYTYLALLINGFDLEAPGSCPRPLPARMR